MFLSPSLNIWSCSWALKQLLLLLQETAIERLEKISSSQLSNIWGLRTTQSKSGKTTSGSLNTRRKWHLGMKSKLTFCKSGIILQNIYLQALFKGQTKINSISVILLTASHWAAFTTIIFFETGTDELSANNLLQKHTKFFKVPFSTTNNIPQGCIKWLSPTALQVKNQENQYIVWRNGSIRRTTVGEKSLKRESMQHHAQYIKFQQDWWSKDQ